MNDIGSNVTGSNVTSLNDGSGAAAPRSGGPVSAAEIDDLVAANRILADQGVLDGYGHVSMRHSGAPDRYFLARSKSPAIITAEDIMEFDLDSNPVDQQGRLMYIERFIHGEIYKSRQDVNAIVHSHSPTVIPFSVTAVKLRPVCHMSAFLKNDVPTFEIRDCDGMTDLLIRNAKHGAGLARTLGAANVALMRGHGNVCVGPNVMTAVYRAVYTEVNARLQAQAIALGGPITFLAPEECDLITGRKDTNYQRPWAMWKSRIAAP
jgi:ribulose-5-phosphate 4-epimerase/fuculose-1-phosphate aldolase